jgi:hypothetical protein
MQVAASTPSLVHEYISPVSDVDIATHESVTQTFSLIPRKAQFVALTSLLAIKLAPEPDAKAIVFLPTARETQIWGALLEAVLKKAGLNPALRLPMCVMHSRLLTLDVVVEAEGAGSVSREVVRSSRLVYIRALAVTMEMVVVVALVEALVVLVEEVVEVLAVEVGVAKGDDS